ncbi:MAG: hypothetical protein ABEJ99_01820 [Candidatus Nanohaloarchaea archaeon]
MEIGKTGEVSRIKVLDRFRSEYIPDVVESYNESYPRDDLEINYTGPMIRSFSGPAATTIEDNSNSYRTSTTRTSGLDFEVTVTDMPYNVENVISGNFLDLGEIFRASEEFDPEEKRTRYIQLEPEKPLEDEEVEDFWHSLVKEFEDVLEPKAVTQKGGQTTFIYDLEDTKL